MIAADRADEAPGIPVRHCAHCRATHLGESCPVCSRPSSLESRLVAAIRGGEVGESHLYALGPRQQVFEALWSLANARLIRRTRGQTWSLT